MDIQMPQMTGIECFHALKQDKNSHQPPVIALTANPIETIRIACIEAGMKAVLSKPIDIKLLEQHIKRELLTLEADSIEI